ncbi:Pr6Pr family membrane protein [Nonomuraea sp. NPDC050310]|uniref:Pr6Pr family membrane protein n=1 Tax=unclassified Nonomuraea TaxID=2593643 RepID=UPI0033DD6ACF
MLFRIVLVLAAVVGLVCTWRGAASPLSPLVYFTVQSNIVLAVYYLARLAGWAGTGRVKGAVTLYICITGLVFNLVLVGGNPFAPVLDGRGDQVLDWGNLLLHTVTPVMAVVDWLLWDRDRGPRWWDAVVWVGYPAGYAVFAVVRGALLAPGTPRRYPYPFLDVSVLGYGGLLISVLVYGAVFVLLGLAVVAGHRLVAGRGRVVEAAL